MNIESLDDFGRWKIRRSFLRLKAKMGPLEAPEVDELRTLTILIRRAWFKKHYYKDPKRFYENAKQRKLEKKRTKEFLKKECKNLPAVEEE